MSDDGEMWRIHRKRSQEKRAFNRENAQVVLREAGIFFTDHNSGAHLIVEGREDHIDYWPGTGKWKCRSGHNGFGLRQLLEYILGEK